MAQPDWRSPAAYEALRSGDAPSLAWEFLSRNAVFAREWTRLERAAERGTLSADDLDGFARRRGVRFRVAGR